MSIRPLVLLFTLPLAVHPSSRLVSQSRPWQATDYYKLTAVAAPQLSPDGRRVAFTVTTVVEDKDKRHTEIWLAAADGSSRPFRFTNPATEAASPVWSPDGSLLAFSSRREGGEDDIWFLRTTSPGGEAFQIPGVHAAPRFSPDGRWVLYRWQGKEPDSLKNQTWRNRVSPTAITRGADPKRFDGRVYTSLPVLADERGLVPPREARRPSHLYVVGIDGGEPRQLTSGALDADDPAWSPDGRFIAFVQDSTDPLEVREQARPELYVLTVATGAIRRVTTGFALNSAPAWSPDGQSLAFVCSTGRGAEDDVCIVPVGGGTARNLTAGWDLDPGGLRWSADGKTVYFSADTRGNAHLFASAVAGATVRQVTTGERQLRGFSFSADTRWIAYTASDITHPVEV